MTQDCPRCRRFGLVTSLRMGDIGEPKREIEFDPLPEEAPVEAPAPATTPAPEPVPA